MRKSEHNKLRSMSVDQLMSLHAATDSLIRQRLNSEKQDLKTKLARIAKYESGFEQRQPVLSKKNSSQQAGQSQTQKKHKKVSPKYRCPNSGQTWSGRGLQPRWLREAVVAGKNPSDFLINKS